MTKGKLNNLKHLIEAPEFEENRIKNCSTALFYLSIYVRAMVSYHDSVQSSAVQQNPAGLPEA